MYLLIKDFLFEFANMSVQVTARAEAFCKFIKNWKFIIFMEVSGSPGCP
jgi:hypothetical protein